MNGVSGFGVSRTVDYGISSPGCAVMVQKEARPPFSLSLSLPALIDYFPNEDRLRAGR